MPYARAKVDERFSIWSVALLFAVPYCVPLLVYTLAMLILGGLGWGVVTAYMCIFFPSGLAAPFISSYETLADGDLCRDTAIGYLAYAVLAALAMGFRKKWQVLSLLAIFLLMMGFNVGGCSRVSAAATRGMHAP